MAIVAFCTLFVWVWLLGFFTNSLVDVVLGDKSISGVGYRLVQEPAWWLTLALCVVACIGPSILMKTFRR